MSFDQPRQKKSKMEKIAELECSLKIAKAENKSIKKELQMMKNGKEFTINNNRSASNLNDSSSNLSSVLNVDKMKEALKALKRVTVNQEMSLQQLRAKGNTRRKQLEEKDEMIAALQKNIQMLLKNQIAMEDDEGDDNKLKVRLNELQRTYLKEEAKNIELQEQLEDAKSKIKMLNKQCSARSSLSKDEKDSLNGSYSNGNLGMMNGSYSSGLHSALHRESSQRSMRSLGLESVSTAHELDVARMKQELAKKSNRIVQLEYELDMVKDEVSELRRKKKNEDMFQDTDIDVQVGGGGSRVDTHSSDPFAAFNNDALGNNNGDDFYSDKEEDDNDWW